MSRTKTLQVLHQGRLVGTLAAMKNNCIAFEYAKDWLAEGFSLNPFSMPLKTGVFAPKYEPFGGLFGVFADSLPDGWGRLLVDRFMLQKGLVPHALSQLDRLAIVGSSGMGSLEYVPAEPFVVSLADYELDQLAAECKEILCDQDCDNLDNLFALGGSSGGARPKILTTVDGNEWIIKFAARSDAEAIGLQEYEYARCAQECGIRSAEVRLFPSRKCPGYFGIKRFDRTPQGKIFMASAGALLETSHRIPNLDYEILMKLTGILCRDQQELEQLFLLMCFNVYAHNRDDHAKNFSLIYDEQKPGWRLSPAYDLTYSCSLQGQHATTVHGNGINPGLEDILAVARAAGLNNSWARRSALQTEEIVRQRLGKWQGHT